ncbi:DUF2604 domain-containing protein [Draconibacterium sp. IB214405]|uniref:DUF2604 domain-containing protein n=1 Tax=Draconibacterium sp. IB214405 TaxID=3097352 RepID=UPI002A170BFE|nr:DUF2604 domain-containing protein [Draconibacterium sp. IB214405]MDX8339766.1 DUF2604 domain-containing protein [Draconibacterium sp. IB214405]
MKPQGGKLTVKVLIENDKVYLEEYNPNQKVQVILNKTLTNLKIDDEGRELRHEDGTPITDFNQTLAEAGIENEETLRFFKKSSKPDRDKGFA